MLGCHCYAKASLFTSLILIGFRGEKKLPIKGKRGTKIGPFFFYNLPLNPIIEDKKNMATIENNLRRVLNQFFLH